MEGRIEVQKNEKGEFIFNRLETLGKHRPEYDPKNEGRYNTRSIENALEDILVGFAAFNDLMNKLPEDNAGITTIFDAIYRDAYQRVYALMDSIKESIGEIGFKFRICHFTNALREESAALTFKPGDLLLKSLNIKDGEKTKNQSRLGSKG